MKYLVITFAQELPDGRIFRHHKRTYNTGLPYELKSTAELTDANDSNNDERDWLKVPGHFVIKQRSN